MKQKIIDAGSGKKPRRIRKITGWYEGEVFHKFSEYSDVQSLTGEKTWHPFDMYEKMIRKTKREIKLKGKNDTVPKIKLHPDFNTKNHEFVRIDYIAKFFAVNTKHTVVSHDSFLSFAMDEKNEKSNVDLVRLMIPYESTTPQQLTQNFNAGPIRGAIDPNLLGLYIYLKKKEDTTRTCLVVPMCKNHRNIIKQVSHVYGHVLMQDWISRKDEDYDQSIVKYQGVYENNYKLINGLAKALGDYGYDMLK